MVSLSRVNDVGYLKNLKYKDIMIRKKASEIENFTQWEKHSNYLNYSAIRAAKEKQWSSKKYLENSLQAFLGENKQCPKRNLEVRRNKLLHLLETEAGNEKSLLEAYSEQLKCKSAMLIRSTALKQERDLEKAKIAENLLAEHFKRNNPDLREMSQVAGQNGIVDHWNCQLIELNKLKQSEQVDQIVCDEMESDAKLHEEKQAEEVELQRLQAREKHLEYLRKQLDELNSRENKAKQLAEKEKCLINQLVKLDQLENQRRLIEEKCQRELYGRELLHQHHTALKKRSTLIQNELKADLNWLHQLKEHEIFNNETSIELKQKERENILSMQKLVECELKKEQFRELELNELESYEASKLWAKREEEWRNETAARQKLLQEVIEDRRKQLENQLALNQQFQREELASREEFLETIENANLIDKLEEKTRHDEMIEQCNQLNNQLSEKITSKRLAENEAKADFEAQEKAELAYEEMLKREAENLHLKENQLKNLTFYRSTNPYSNRSSHC
ncbi:hypothetical protein MN116_007493 [Schistosoma mekongi]|uniref:Trichoplein keratin filament-binding protein n=1 Tax=Schistosoma mekongi TaxID=38744 RepID=A0AAE1Z8X6_SCHME|nr:hypothetical protein MN116_007493 [Schistosoma mekongi]